MKKIKNCFLSDFIVHLKPAGRVGHKALVYALCLLISVKKGFFKCNYAA